MTAASVIHINIFGPHPIVVSGTPEQQSSWLRPLIKGEERCCFGVTEPDADLDTGCITTRTERTDSGYLVYGRKIWTSTAQHADKIILLARTSPIEQCEKRADGLSLFYADLDRNHVEVQEAAWLYGQKKSCGAEANATKYFASEAAHTAATRSVTTHGGMGYAPEYHVERLLRESFIPKLASVSAQMILC